MNPSDDMSRRSDGDESRASRVERTQRARAYILAKKDERRNERQQGQARNARRKLGKEVRGRD